MEGIEPDLVKAGVFLRNSDSAAMPSLVPRIFDSAIDLDASSRMLRYSVNLGQSCNLVSRVPLLHGQLFGSRIGE